MSEISLFSAHWHRVKEVRPRLAGDVTVSRHVYRGRSAFLLHRRATSACHRLDVASFELVDRLDGETSVGQLWERALVERDDQAPTQDEWIALLAELYAAELIVVDQRVAEEKLFERRQKHRVTRRRQRYLNPLYLRFALHNPDKWLTKLEPLAGWVFSRSAALIWLLLIVAATATALSQFDQLWSALNSSALFNAQNALMFLLIYLPIKLLHEFAHALAIKRAGGHVHETGIAIMVLIPLPYVDARASALFTNKYDRMLVSVAGILLELACAAAGLLLWAHAEGSLQAIGLMMFLVGGVSTLLLNGNPLLKFDGYYLLADWIEIPNLATRARRAVLSRLRSFVSGAPLQINGVEDRAERLWLLGYGVLSSVYRTVLMLSIAWMLSDRWPLLGAALALFIVLVTLLLPAFRTMSALIKDPVYRCGRTVLLAGALPMLLLAVGYWLPIPRADVVPGVVWIPDDAVLRVSSDCDVSKVFTRPGEPVSAGDTLFLCDDHQAQARLQELVARVDELHVRRAAELARDPLVLETLEAELRASEAALADAQERIDAQLLQAKLDGRFNVVETSLLHGRSLERGEIVGYVVPPLTRTVRIAIDERSVTRFDNDLNTVQVRFTGAGGQSRVFDTQVIKRTPKATRVVANAALSSYGGGMHAAHPDGDGRLLKDAVFDVELAWPELASPAMVGSHIGVRLVYTPAPLFAQLGTTLRHAFNRQILS